jgi:hypothetical protein
MFCPHRASDTQAEFTAEMMIHFSGVRHIDTPGVLVFPKVLVCLDCGYSRFTTPKTELALLVMRSPASDASTRKEGVRDVATLYRTSAACA